MAQKNKGLCSPTRAIWTYWKPLSQVHLVKSIYHTNYAEVYVLVFRYLAVEPFPQEEFDS